MIPFSSPQEVDIGLAADIGTLQRLPKVIGNDSLARELAFTARPFSAQEAAKMGFVSRVLEGGHEAVVGKSWKPQDVPGSPVQSTCREDEADLWTCRSLALDPRDRCCLGDGEGDCQYVASISLYCYALATLVSRADTPSPRCHLFTPPLPLLSHQQNRQSLSSERSI